MTPAKVKFNYNNGKGFEAAQEYAEKLFKHGFKYSCTYPEGGKIYHHYELNIDVIVYVV